MGPCDGAEALRSSKQFDAALALYLELLKKDPPPACVINGVAQLPPERAAASVALARRLLELGFKAAAADELRKALAWDPAIAIDAGLQRLGDQALADDSFAAAQRLLDTGLRVEARDALRKAITDHPSATVPPTLVMLGDQIAADDAFAGAGRLLASGLHAEARDALKKAITDHPNATIPPTLAALGDQIAADDAFAAARNLRDRGFHSEARDALKKAITDHPAASVPPDLIDYQIAVPEWFQRLIDGLAAASQWLLQLLAGLLVLVFFAWALGSGLTWWLRAWDLRVTDFTGDTSQVESVAAVVAEEIRRLDKDGGGRNLQVADATAQEFEMPDLGDALPQAKGFAAIAAFLLGGIWHKSYVLDGVVHSPGDRGAGLTLTISRRITRTKLLDSVTLWERDFEPWPHPIRKDDASPYYRLATLAAVWTGYAVRRKGEAANARITIPNFATQNWRSYAYFASGADRYKRGEPERAQVQFLLAIEIDPDNYLAGYDLAMIEWDDVAPDSETYNERAAAVASRLERVRAGVGARAAAATP